jgi:hypothetical protein
VTVSLPTIEAFLDIEGSFERISLETIKQAAERHGIEPAVSWKAGT